MSKEGSMKQTMLDSADHMTRVAGSLNRRIAHHRSGLAVAKKHGWEDRIVYYQDNVDKLSSMRANWTRRANTIRAQAALIKEN
jgi:hypothetical protein